MGLLAHQKLIIDTVAKTFCTSVSIPRQNGKTYTGIAAAYELGGHTVFMSCGYKAVLAALDHAKAIIPNAKSGKQSITWDDGYITFLPYSKNAGLGLTADLLVLDDADMGDSEAFARLVPVISAKPDSHILALSAAPDRGLAAHIYGIADAKLRWASDSIPLANPGIPGLKTMESVLRCRDIMTESDYRRNCLGLCDDPAKTSALRKELEDAIEKSGEALREEVSRICARYEACE